MADPRSIVRTISEIKKHIKNIYEEGELEESVTMRKFGNTEFSTKPTNFYNLDVIISVGYRVKSQRGVQFRIWATTVLKEYMRKGFALDDERLKGNGGGNYWKELSPVEKEYLDTVKRLQKNAKNKLKENLKK